MPITATVIADKTPQKLQIMVKLSGSLLIYLPCKFLRLYHYFTGQ